VVVEKDNAKQILSISQFLVTTK